MVLTQAAALVQIGQLLTKSGLLSPEQLAEALIRSKERGLPLGTILLTLGQLRQDQLRAAVEAQSLVNDGVVTSDMAVTALAKSSDERSSLDEALRALGANSKAKGGTNRLGELLIDAGILKDDQLSDCLLTSRETGMPLGRVLIFKRIITDEVLVAALRAQRYIREGVIPREDAVDVLKKVNQKKISLDESMAEGGFLRNRVKRSMPVGYLLVEAGYLSESSLAMCVEFSLSDNRTMVDTLVEQGFAVRPMAEAALVLQQLINHGTITKALACSALRIVDTKGVDANRALAESGMQMMNESRRRRLHELLVLCGCIDPRVHHEIAGDLSSYDHLEDVLLTLDVPPHVIPCAVRSMFMMEAKFLGSEDCVMALHYCRRNQVSLDEALTIMGWKPPHNAHSVKT
jgi:hypothetical protein